MILAIASNKKWDSHLIFTAWNHKQIYECLYPNLSPECIKFAEITDETKTVLLDLFPITQLDSCEMTVVEEKVNTNVWKDSVRRKWTSDGDKGYAQFYLDGREIDINGHKETVRKLLELIENNCDENRAI